MKKAIFITFSTAALLSTSLSANQTTQIGKISTHAGKKDYSNSKTKVDGKTYGLNYNQNIKDFSLSLGYAKDSVNRIDPVSKAPTDTLNVKKYNLKLDYNLNKQLALKTSYLKIIDNLAPTDQGKVYGIGATYKLPKGFGVGFDYYKSNYNPFNVNQYDLAVYKGFKIDELKGKVTVGTKFINIDGETYNPNDPLPKQYDFYDKNYNTTFVKLGVNYNGFTAGAGAFFGKRIFTVMDNGTKVQHHAMEQDKTYMLSLGKKFKSFDIIAKYSYQNGKELPEIQDDVDTKVTSLALSYKF